MSQSKESYLNDLLIISGMFFSIKGERNVLLGTKFGSLETNPIILSLIVGSNGIGCHKFN